MQMMHIARLCTHCTLACVAVALVSTNGYSCVPGFTVMQYAYTNWDNSTLSDWQVNQLPSPVMVTLPGDTTILTVWLFTTVIMLVNDLLCCGLTRNNLWYLEANHVDMGWHTSACVGLPLLFLCVASLLGSHDVVVLALIAVITSLSSLCGLLMEQVLAHTNTGSTDGLLNNVVFVLHTAQHVSLIIAAEVVLIPAYVNDAMQNETLDSSQRLLVLLFTALVGTLCATSFSHNRACNKFELAHANDASMMSWDTPPEAPLEAGQQLPQQHTPFEVLVIPDSGDDTTTTTTTTTHCVTVTAVLTGAAHNSSSSTPSHPNTMVMRASIVRDDDSRSIRKTIGENTEWRRYYGVTIFIDAVLVILLFKMTGVIGRC